MLDLENVKVECKAQYSSNRVQVAIGPTLNLGRGSTSSIYFGINIDFNPSTTKQGCGAEISVSGRKNSCEVSIDSSVSKSGVEHGCTATVHGFSNFNCGLRVYGKSFKQMLHPVNVIDHGQLFAGRTLQRDRLKTNVRFSVLPVKNLKNVFSSGADNSRFESSYISFEEQNQVDSKDPNQDLELVFKQDKSETAFSLKEVQQESNKEQETLEQGKRETTNQKDHMQRQQLLVPPPVQPTPVSRGLNYSYYLFGSLFLLWLYGKIESVLNPDQNKKKGL